MQVLFNVLIIITSIILVLIVLVQNSKGGGLVSNFSSSNQMMGVRKTTDFLEKATWSLAIALVIFCFASTATLDKKEAVEARSSFEENQVQTEQPNNIQAPAGLQTADGVKDEN